MSSARPARLPNGLRLVDGTADAGAAAAPLYVREAMVTSAPAALRVERDTLSDANAAAGRMWRLASTFGGVADVITRGPEEAAHAIVDGLVAHGDFATLRAALVADRSADDTKLSVDELETLSREVGTIEAELRSHIANAIVPGGCPTATNPRDSIDPASGPQFAADDQVALIQAPPTVNEAITPAGIATAAAALHISLAALVFSPEVNSQYAPDSPRRNRGRALIARLHQTQAQFERGTPGATSADPNAYAEAVTAAFRTVAARVTSLTVPSTVDTVAAHAIARWASGVVDELEAVGRDARALGIALRRLNLVWEAERRSASEDAGDAATVATAVDPFDLRVSFGKVAAEAAAAIPQEFDFSSDDARRAADKTLVEIASSAPIKNDATLRALTLAVDKLVGARDKLAGRWAHVAKSAPQLVLAARDFTRAKGHSDAAATLGVETVYAAEALLRDPKDVEHKGLAKRCAAVARSLHTAFVSVRTAPAAEGESASPAELLADSAREIADWAASIAALEEPAKDAATAIVRPALARIRGFLDGAEALGKATESLRTALLTQCLPADLQRASSAPRVAADAARAACNVAAASPCVIASAIAHRLEQAAAALSPDATLKLRDSPALRPWALLARAWARATAAFPAVEKSITWETNAVCAKLRIKCTSPLAADSIAAAEGIAPGMALDYAVSDPDGLDPVPAVADAFALALIATVQAYNGADAEGWVVPDRRVAVAADIEGSWRFVIFAATLRRLAAAAGDAPTEAAIPGTPFWAAVPAASAGRRHAAVRALDACLEAIASVGVDAAHLCDPCNVAIAADVATFAPEAALLALQRKEESGDLSGVCPQCSWWNPAADLAPATASPAQSPSAAAEAAPAEAAAE